MRIALGPLPQAAVPRLVQPTPNPYGLSWGLVALGSGMLAVGGYILAAKVNRLARVMHPAAWAAVMGTGGALVLSALRYLTAKRPQVPVLRQVRQASHLYQAVTIVAQDAAQRLLDEGKIHEVQSEEARAKIARLATFHLIMGAEDLGETCVGKARLAVAPGLELTEDPYGGDPQLSDPDAPVYPISARRSYERLGAADRQWYYSRWMVGEEGKAFDSLFGLAATAIRTRFMPQLEVTTGQVRPVAPAEGQETHIYDYLTRLYKTVGAELVREFAITASEYTLLPEFLPTLHSLVAFEMLYASTLESDVDGDTLTLTPALRAHFHPREMRSNLFTAAGLVLREPVVVHCELGRLVELEVPPAFTRNALLAPLYAVRRRPEPVQTVDLVAEIQAIGTALGQSYFPSCATAIYSALPFAPPSQKPTAQPRNSDGSVRQPASVALQPSHPNLTVLQEKYRGEVRLGGPRLPWTPPKPFTPWAFADICRPGVTPSEEALVHRLTHAHFYAHNNFAQWGKCLYGAAARAIFGGDHQMVYPSHGSRYRKDYSESEEHVAELERIVQSHRAAHPDRYRPAKDKRGWPDDLDLQALSEIFQVPIYVIYGGAGQNAEGVKHGIPMSPELETDGTLKPHVKFGEEWDAEPIRLLCQNGHYQVLHPLKD